MRILQRGFPDLVILYLVGSHLDERVRSCLPRATIVVFDDAKGLSPSEVAKSLGMNVRSLVVIGFSAGCQAVRSAIVGAEFPPHERLGIVAVDGTHASLPAEKWQVAVWRKLGEEARRGEKLCVATCSNNVYTARLASPFMPTLHVMRQAFEPNLFPATPPHEIHARDLHLYAYDSAECDKDAHARQQIEVLPMVLEKHVRLWLKREWTKQTPLDIAQGFVGWKETGLNQGDLVRRSLARCVRDGRPLGIIEGVPWCAAFVGLCDHLAGAQHTWRASVREIVSDAVIARTWREASDYEPSPGDLAIFKRDGKDPRLGAEGHVERVERCDANSVTTIGGNVGDQVVRHVLSLGTPDLVGWIVRHESALTDEDRALVEANTATSIKRFVGATLGV